MEREKGRKREGDGRMDGQLCAELCEEDIDRGVCFTITSSYSDSLFSFLISARECQAVSFCEGMCVCETHASISA